MIKNLTNQIKTIKIGLGVVVLLTLLKLVLVYQMPIYICPPLAPIDDDLMFRAALSITEGNWLGEYNWLTMSKHMFFSVWLALLHFLKIPYHVGGQLLWAAACAVCAQAFSPVLPKGNSKAVLYLFLLWNPATVAEFTFRVYRDNIFPALCLLFFSAVIGVALRCSEAVLKQLPYLIIMGLSFGLIYLTREDGIWVLPFYICGTAITLFFILQNKTLKNKVQRLAVFIIPVILSATCIAAYCGMNYRHYGRFIVSDFTSSEFQDAVGAMTRITPTEWDPYVSVPLETRELLYEHAPLFALLEGNLEGADIGNSYRHSYSGDFRSGAYYWALRKAVFLEGFYIDASSSEAYYVEIASQINALCDAGIIPAGPARSGTTPPFNTFYILPTLQESARSTSVVLLFNQTNPRVAMSVGRPDEIQEVEEYLYSYGIVAAIENTAEPYYSPVLKLVYLFFDAIRFCYAIILPLLFCIGIFSFFKNIAVLFKKDESQTEKILFWVLLGLLLMSVLRIAMISFMEVSSFQIGTYIMYLSTVHPLILIFAFFSLRYVKQKAKP